MISHAIFQQPARSSADRLPTIEQETLTQFARGRSYCEAAKQRGNSVITTRTALYRIQDKLALRRNRNSKAGPSAAACSTMLSWISWHSGPENHADFTAPERSRRLGITVCYEPQRILPRRLSPRGPLSLTQAASIAGFVNT